jgi:hypothetical protein
MIRAPRPIAPKFAWLNKLRSFAKSSQIQPGSGYRVERTTAGTTIRVGKPTMGGGGNAKLFKVVAILEDTLTCHAIASGVPVTTTSFTIAKPPELALSAWKDLSISYTVAGKSFSVTYTQTDMNGAQTRSAAGNNLVETQMIVPYYRVGSFIYAIQCPNAATSWIDLNVDARAWANVTEVAA